MKSTVITSYSIHYTKLYEPNRFIDFETHRLKVVSEDTDLPKDARVGISSFGFGGANAHLIIRGAAESARKEMRKLDSPFRNNFV